MYYPERKNCLILSGKNDFTLFLLKKDLCYDTFICMQMTQI
jgi:hypothetical protein